MRHVNRITEGLVTASYVVDGIYWWREGDGSVQADGGEARWWKNWTAKDDSLVGDALSLHPAA